MVSLKLPKKNCFGKFYKHALTIAGDDEHAKPIFESFEDDLNSKFKLHFLQEIHQILMKIVIIVMKIMKTLMIYLIQMIDTFLASITISNGYEIISLCVFMCVRVMCTNSDVLVYVYVFVYAFVSMSVQGTHRHLKKYKITQPVKPDKNS